MNNEARKNPEQQKQQDPTGSAKISDTKPNPSEGSQNQSNPRQQDPSKKNPSTDSNPQHKDQQKPGDAKRHAS
jgi:hypothetical protein